jgi:hypothetical protein
VRDLAPFAIGSVIKKLNRITVAINTTYCRPFPKPDCFLLSHYRYQRRHITINPNGRIRGGLSRFVTSLIDFSLRGVGSTSRRPSSDPLLPIDTI